MSLLAAWIVGQILRDRNWWTGLIFYLPTPVLVAWLLLLLGCSRTSRRFYAGLMILPLLSLLIIENHWMRQPLPSTAFVPPAAPQDSDLSPAGTDNISQRLIHWNIARGAMGWEHQWKHIASLAPDIVVLSEIPVPFDPSLLYGFDVLVVDEMAVACHGRVTRSGPLVKRRPERLSRNVRTFDGDARTVNCRYDVKSPSPRNRYLQPFVSLLAEHRIDVSVGDFNAPRRSLAFSHLPEGFQHAYDAWCRMVLYVARADSVSGNRSMHHWTSRGTIALYSGHDNSQ